MAKKRKRNSSGAKKGKKKAGKKRVPSEATESEDDYSLTTNPSNVRGPVEDLVHASLEEAYRVRRVKFRSMPFIFDTYSPARLFKRGVVYNEDEDFPLHNGDPEEDSEATETDTQPPGLMPYAPMPFRYVLRLTCCPA